MNSLICKLNRRVEKLHKWIHWEALYVNNSKQWGNPPYRKRNFKFYTSIQYTDSTLPQTINGYWVLIDVWWFQCSSKQTDSSVPSNNWFIKTWFQQEHETWKPKKKKKKENFFWHTPMLASKPCHKIQWTTLSGPSCNRNENAHEQSGITDKIIL